MPYEWRWWRCVWSSLATSHTYARPSAIHVVRSWCAVRNRLGESTLTRLKHAAVILAASAGISCGEGQPEAVAQVDVVDLQRRSAAFAGRDAATLISDTDAQVLGQELFAAHCASCHGAEGRQPARGVPALATAPFDYGGSLDVVRITISQGRHSVMPKHGGLMGEVDIGSLVAYVQSLASGESMQQFEKTARALYETHCVACHGAAGEGNSLLGSPDLTDNYWQHGDAMMNIRLAITRGTESRCPAHADTLGPAEIELLAAYVLRLRAG